MNSPKEKAKELELEKEDKSAAKAALSPKENKKEYGEFRLVKLTDSEYEKLGSLFSVSIRELYIAKLDLYHKQEDILHQISRM